MNATSSRRLVRSLAFTLALGLAPATALTAVPTASATVCEAQWGSLTKARPRLTGKQVTNVRSGRHQCFDRLVIDLNGDGKGKPGYRVRYVKKVTADGSGKKVKLRGNARLRVVVHAPAYDDDGQPTYTPADPTELVDVTGYSTFRQVAWAGTFEGYTTLGVGVRARLPMRVLVLDGPDGGRRVVVDVAHHWY